MAGFMKVADAMMQLSGTGKGGLPNFRYRSFPHALGLKANAPPLNEMVIPDNNGKVSGRRWRTFTESMLTNDDVYLTCRPGDGLVGPAAVIWALDGKAIDDLLAIENHKKRKGFPRYVIDDRFLQQADHFCWHFRLKLERLSSGMTVLDLLPPKRPRTRKGSAE